MLLIARFAGLTLFVITSAAVLVPNPLSARVTIRGQEAGNETDNQPIDIDGTKMLIAFDRYSWRSREYKERQEEFLQALKDTEVKILMTYQFGRYVLLDCEERDPGDIIKNVPNHGGAMAFRDGKLTSVMASHDKKKLPQKFAMLQWASTAADVKRMQADVEKYSKMPGVVAEKINLAPGKKMRGNPWMLKLKPAKSTTLLEVFIMAKGRFHYEVVESGEKIAD